MDAEALEDITERINPQRGLKSEINRVLSKNKSLRESDSWDKPSRSQQASIRKRLTANKTHKGLKYKENNKTFIRVDKNNYKRVTSQKDVYVDKESSTVWIRDDKGQFKEVVR